MQASKLGSVHASRQAWKRACKQADMEASKRAYLEECGAKDADRDRRLHRHLNQPLADERGTEKGPKWHLEPATRHAAHVEGSIRPRSEEKDADKPMALCEIDGHYLQRARSGSAMGDEWTRESDAYSTSAKRAAMKLRCVLRLVP